MACVRVLRIFALLSLICAVSASQLIYRKYEKKHPKKNYVQVVEIFGTRGAPPRFIKDDRELNDFLAGDAYKSDMNCTKSDDVETQRPVTRPLTSTLPTIPTTAFRWLLTTPTPQVTTESQTPKFTKKMNNLFTMRTTKPTIKPNPRENNNPDYRNIFEPNVQVTKHPPSTSVTTMVIQEPDDESRTTLRDVDSGKTTSTTTAEPDDDIIYADSDNEDDNGDDYNEDNYPDIVPPDQINPTKEYNEEEDSGENENDDYDDADELGKRRKRHKPAIATPLKSDKH